jgi:hypothetical protein
MADDLTPAAYADAIDAARRRLMDFVRLCPDDLWRSAPVPGDPRQVGVIADHVAHSYEYLAGWIGDVAAGQLVEVNTDLVDDLNAGRIRRLATVAARHADGHRAEFEAGQDAA